MTESGDFTISLSSEVIAEVMGKHFNKEMFKRAVTIVDLKPLEDGYQFLLAYTQQALPAHPVYQAVQEAMVQQTAESQQLADQSLQVLMDQAGPIDYARTKNGRFAKKEG